MTLPVAEMYDFKAVCSKLMRRYPKELAEGSLSQGDFRKIQEKHIQLWTENAYIQKVPVRYIGLQVCKLGRDKIVSIYLIYLSTIFYRKSLMTGLLTCWSFSSLMNWVCWEVMGVLSAILE